MNILAKNDTKSSSDFIQRKNVVNAILVLKRSYNKVYTYYHISRTSAWRWVKRYKENPCDESLMLRSHRPKTIPKKFH